MKKITLGAFLFASLYAGAQMNLLNNAVGTSYKEVNRPHSSISTVAGNANSTQAVGTYFLRYFLYKELYDSLSTGTFSPFASMTYYAQTTFMDSTVQNSDATATRYISDMKFGTLIDPKSLAFDLDNSFTTPVITATESYTLDTLVAYGIYQSRNTFNDTLMFEVCWGDTNLQVGTSSVWNKLGNATGRWLTPNVSSSSPHGYVSKLTAPPIYKRTFKKVLTPADAANSGFIVGVKAQNGGVDLVIPAGNIISVVCTFVPGTAYPFGDVCYEYANPLDPASQNGFAAYLRGPKPAVTPPTATYYYDRTTIGGNKKSWNNQLFQSPVQRYAKLTGGIAFYNKILNWNDNYAWDIGVVVTVKPVGINENTISALKVSQNTPNPASNLTSVNYELNENAAVSLEVFDMTGKKVSSVNEGKQTAGNHAIQLNTENIQAGAYFYTLTAGDSRITKKMTIIK